MRPPLVQRLRFLSRLIEVVLWTVVAVAVGLAVANMLAGRSWIAAAAAAVVAVVAAVPLGRSARCGHYAQLFHGVEGLGYLCRRPVGHRGAHEDHACRWDDAGAFLTTDRRKP